MKDTAPKILRLWYTGKGVPSPHNHLDVRENQQARDREKQIESEDLCA